MDGEKLPLISLIGQQVERKMEIKQTKTFQITWQDNAGWQIFRLVQALNDKTALASATDKELQREGFRAVSVRQIEA